MRALASGVVPSASAKQIGTPICDGSPYLFSLSVRLLGYFHDRIPLFCLMVNRTLMSHDIPDTS